MSPRWFMLGFKLMYLIYVKWAILVKNKYKFKDHCNQSNSKLTSTSLFQEANNKFITATFQDYRGKVFTLKRLHLQRTPADFDTYLYVECCKTQGNFQYFKAAFMMTPWVHTMTSPRTVHLHTSPTLNTQRYKLYYNWSSVKCLYWILRAKVSPCVFLFTKPLYCLALEDQRAFWTVAPCFRAERMVAWASSKEDKFY